MEEELLKTGQKIDEEREEIISNPLNLNDMVSHWKDFVVLVEIVSAPLTSLQRQRLGRMLI